MFHPKGPSFLELIKQGLSSTKEGYDQIASKFDYTPFVTDQRIIQEAVRILENERLYESAIDLCTGTGAGIIGLHGIVRNRILGVDWSAPMLAEARKKFEQNGAMLLSDPLIKLVQDDVYSLKYRDAFDLATCFGALGHIEKKRYREFVSMVNHALKSNGRFAFVTSEKPRLTSPWFWFFWGFDMLMKVRNILRRPKFVMYYLNFLLPEVLQLFNNLQWASVKVVPMKIDGKPSRARLVIATKK